MTFPRLSKYFLGFSAILVLASATLFVVAGPKYSIEFTGGTLLQIELPADKTRDDVISALQSYEESAGSADATIQPDAGRPAALGNFTVTAVKTASEEAFLIRLRPMDNEEHISVLAHLRTSLGDVKELKYNTIGPSLSRSLKAKSLQAIAFASVAVILYLAIAFRKLPRKLNPWKFGVLAIIGFLHDVIVTVGVFIVIGWFTTFEFDTLFVTALLTILAYSANDTIVIFDRIRANMTFENRSEELSKIIVAGLRQCVTRTFSTAFASLIMLISLFFLGSDSIRWFILALIFGTVIGAYSSYFVAAPLLMYWK
ncbi:protein translocase subunit SecF [Candidatus Peregrinibacteria bacterium]|nr:protein translocase subunit SecF [Candidatus Peregrinibacteria bacterium]